MSGDNHNQADHARECIGVLGRWLGHKFWSLDEYSPHCLRCGFTPRWEVSS